MGYSFLEYTLLFVKKSIGTIEQRLLQTLLVERRESLGLKQTELAVKLNVAQSFVSKYENGERRLDVIELRNVCLALDITLCDFVHKLENAIDHHLKNSREVLNK